MYIGYLFSKYGGVGLKIRSLQRVLTISKLVTD